MKHVPILILILCSFVSCDHRRIFEEYKPIGFKGWHKDSAMVFSIHLAESYRKYNMYLNVRNRGTYPNRNLWLSVAMHYPDGRFRTDTVEMILADPSGKWKGSGIGDLFDCRMLYMQDVLLPDTGMYQVIIKQAMRPMRLKGIQDIGFRLEKGKY